MKIKKKVTSLVVLLTLLMNILGVYAETISVNQAWNQLSSSQRSKLEQVGIDDKLLNKMDTALDGTDISSFISPPLTYENNQFIISQQNAEQVLLLLSIASGKEFDSDRMMAVFNDVIGDINKNSSDKTREEFAKLLEQHGLSSTGEIGGQLPMAPGGGGSPAAQKGIQKKLEEKLLEFEEKEKHTKVQQADFQKLIEVLSSYMIDPLTSFMSEDIQNAWKKSTEWQTKNAKGIVFAKTNAPVARWNVLDNMEITIPQRLWENVSSYGRIELEAGSIVISIEKNTYNNDGSKIKIKPITKEGYKQGVIVSSTAKMYSPAKIAFYMTDEAPQDYGVYKLEDNKEILIGGIYNEALGAVETLIKSSGTYVLKKASAKECGDLSSVSWAKNEINHLGQKGYIAGKAEGVYAPKDAITRAEFAVLLRRILQLPTTSRNNNFKDMKSDAWYYNDVMATVEAKLFNGKSASSFDPSGKITRQEVVAVISRVLVQKGYNEPQVEEVNKDIWAPGAIALMKDQSLTTQIPNFNDHIRENANRAEVAYILYNLLQR